LKYLAKGQKQTLVLFLTSFIYQIKKAIDSPLPHPTSTCMVWTYTASEINVRVFKTKQREYQKELSFSFVNLFPMQAPLTIFWYVLQKKRREMWNVWHLPRCVFGRRTHTVMLLTYDWYWPL